MRGRAALCLFVGAAVFLTGCPKPPPPPPPPTPEPTPTPSPTPRPVPALVRKPLPTATLFNGLSLESAVVATPANELASADRREADAYKVELTLRARLPRPAVTIEDFVSNDPNLPGVFKDLPDPVSYTHLTLPTKA